MFSLPEGNIWGNGLKPHGEFTLPSSQEMRGICGICLCRFFPEDPQVSCRASTVARHILKKIMSSCPNMSFFVVNPIMKPFLRMHDLYPLVN